MPQIHLDVDAETRALLTNQAKEWNYTLKDFAIRTLKSAAKRGGRPLFIERPAPVADPAFRFIDLFAGIGGFRLALEGLKGQCVFSSEWDRWSQVTYQERFGEKPHGDINQIDPKSIPDHNLLAAGFPCQPFSLAGVSKKKSLGRKHGFQDKAQGTLFFRILEVLKAKRPNMFLLENVKNLKSHDNGRTYEVIRGSLEELGYAVFDRVIDARHWVPQHRERVFIAGFDKRVFGKTPEFAFDSKLPNDAPTLTSVLQRTVKPRYRLSNKLWNYLQAYAKKHRERGNGFGFGLCTGKSVARTLSARYHKDGSEILIKGYRGRNPRRLTPRECARLMGFPADFPILVSDTQAYRQFGNAVVVPVARWVAEQMLDTYFAHKRKTRK